jgi:hypothetical protein
MLKRHISIGVFVGYIGTGSSVPGVPSKSRDLADENNKIYVWFVLDQHTVRFLLC